MGRTYHGVEKSSLNQAADRHDAFTKVAEIKRSKGLHKEKTPNLCYQGRPGSLTVALLLL